MNHNSLGHEQPSDPKNSHPMRRMRFRPHQLCWGDRECGYHTHHAHAMCLCSLVQGFREKNRDLMRQDIIDVLRTSHMDLVRALIGLPPYAVHRWHMAYLKIIATFAFRSGIEGTLPSNLHVFLRRVVFQEYLEDFQLM